MSPTYRINRAAEADAIFTYEPSSLLLRYCNLAPKSEACRSNCPLSFILFGPSIPKTRSVFVKKQLSGESAAPIRAKLAFGAAYFALLHPTVSRNVYMHQCHTEATCGHVDKYQRWALPDTAAPSAIWLISLTEPVSSYTREYHHQTKLPLLGVVPIKYLKCLQLHWATPLNYQPVI